ncbi:MAG: CDP-diacylglycerol--glycerol-3-phosphate 3-phosphatidyltransferase [uncultured Solirubrobacteraceae bacterium]|uniref:CDP-diacylglycerol--glycerol-3-phosphate 3-phosphatidyltransferase n=1 Tax=uncultured Solirubrobacteraceae bacterium TaxID=1162706 RepID=A0A6J4SI38_9ACTN|nr:MAG: CDP-diacylglycerol--glycerol-3-phosphate 3-phosphatidyltransferase [uncultured Solirubrobacteraceae bacterium]
MARPPVAGPEAGDEPTGAEKVRLTFRRLTGLDRSGPPPEQTRRDQPWHVWTVPNVIGMVRAVLIPIFLYTALTSEDGTDALPAILFGVAAWGDYADGITARLTGQYSRFGALLDPVVDRLLIISGLVVVWRFDLLPRWALALLVFRELLMLVGGRYAVNRGVEVSINWPGRIAVFPVMSAVFFALCGLETFAEILLYLGLALSWAATWLYIQRARAELAGRPAPSSSP